MAKKNHYSWWPYIRDAVQAYPASQGEDLCGVALLNYEAVRDAVEATEHMQNAVNRMKVIELVHFRGVYKLEGAALRIPCSRSLAAKWQREFFEEVARNRGLLD